MISKIVTQVRRLSLVLQKLEDTPRPWSAGGYHIIGILEQSAADKQ